MAEYIIKSAGIEDFATYGANSVTFQMVEDISQPTTANEKTSNKLKGVVSNLFQPRISCLLSLPLLLFFCFTNFTGTLF